MVEYHPRGELLDIDDTTEDENLKLRKALDVLLSMITGGRSLVDIQIEASQVANNIGWPYLRKIAPLEMEEE